MSVDPLFARPSVPTFAWLREGKGFAAWGKRHSLHVATGSSRWSTITSELEGVWAEQPHATSIACGSFTFDESESGSALFVPEAVTAGAFPPMGRSQDDTRGPARIRYAGSSRADLDWLEAVAGALERIDHKELEKVVLARDVHVWAESDFDLVALADRLRHRFPECFTFICDGLVGATPELLVRRSGREFESMVLAGSAPRGPDPTSDETIGSELLDSAKDLSEHAMAVESVRDVMAPLARSLQVREPRLLKLANVQHLSTTVTGHLHEPVTALELAGLLHPTAAVCGTPRSEALTSIRLLEGMSRGRYAGPIGWVDRNGDGEWGIALRCGQFTGSRGRLFAGAGIVAGSRPELELEETRLKLRAIQSALENSPRMSAVAVGDR